MHSFAASSNALVTISPTRVNQLRSSTFSCQPLTNLEISHQFNFSLNSNTVSKRFNVQAAHMTSASKLTSPLDFNGRMRTNKLFEVELQVRDNELDQYGIVNNPVYSSYCQYGHEELLKRVGLNTDAVAQSGEATILSDLSLKFFSTLRSGDRFVVKTKISCISTTSIFVEDFIFKLPNRELILEAKATIVLIGRNYRPIHISPGAKANLLLLDLLDGYERYFSVVHSTKNLFRISIILSDVS